MEGIGAKLKLLRDKSGLSQADVARRIGVSKDYYWELEKAEKKAVSGDILYRIAKVHDIDMEWFFRIIACERCGDDKTPLKTSILTAAKHYLDIQYLCAECLEQAVALQYEQWQQWLDWRAKE